MRTRTTVNLDEQVLRDAKRAAADSGQTLGAFLEDALRERLARKNATPAQKRRITLPVGTGVPAPGFDPSPEGIRALLEQEDIERYGRPS